MTVQRFRRFWLFAALHFVAVLVVLFLLPPSRFPTRWALQVLTFPLVQLVFETRVVLPDNWLVMFVVPCNSLVWATVLNVAWTRLAAQNAAQDEAPAEKLLFFNPVAALAVLFGDALLLHSLWTRGWSLPIYLFLLLWNGVGLRLMFQSSD